MDTINPRELIKTLVHPPTPQHQADAWRALRELGEAGDDAVVEYFLEFDYEAHDWSCLTKAIERMGDTFLEKIAAGLQYAEHDSRTDDLFELIEGFGDSAVPYLIRILNDELSCDFAANAARSLGNIGGESAAAALTRAADELPGHLDTDSVMEALAQVGDDHAKSLLIAAIKGDHEDKRSGAIWAMRDCPGPEFIEPLACALRDYDDYREGIIDSLAEIIDADVIPVLESLLKGEQRDVRIAANKQLGVLKKKLAHLEAQRGADGRLAWPLAFKQITGGRDEGVAFELSEARVVGGVFSGTVKNTGTRTIRDIRFDLEYSDHHRDVLKTDTRNTTSVSFPLLPAGEGQDFSIPVDVPVHCHDVSLRRFDVVPTKERPQPMRINGFAIILVVSAIGFCLKSC